MSARSKDGRLVQGRAAWAPLRRPRLRRPRLRRPRLRRPRLRRPRARRLRRPRLRRPRLRRPRLRRPRLRRPRLRRPRLRRRRRGDQLLRSRLGRRGRERVYELGSIYGRIGRRFDCERAGYLHWPQDGAGPEAFRTFADHPVGIGSRVASN